MKPSSPNASLFAVISTAILSSSTLFATTVIWSGQGVGSIGGTGTFSSNQPYQGTSGNGITTTYSPTSSQNSNSVVVLEDLGLTGSLETMLNYDNDTLQTVSVGGGNGLAAGNPPTLQNPDNNPRSYTIGGTIQYLLTSGQGLAPDEAVYLFFGGLSANSTATLDQAATQIGSSFSFSTPLMGFSDREASFTAGPGGTSIYQPAVSDAQGGFGQDLNGIIVQLPLGAESFSLTFDTTGSDIITFGVGIGAASAVPEPSNLFLLSLSGLIFMRRQR